MPRRTRLWLVLAFLALTWGVLRLLGGTSLISLQVLHDAFQQHLLGGTLLFCALFVVANLGQIPGWLFLAAAVLALGPAWGAGVTYVAACLSCSVTFWVVRAMGADGLRTLRGRWARRMFAQLDAQPVRSVFLLRLVFQTAPVLNYALALSGIPFRPYALGTLAGLPVPIALFSVFLRTLAGWMHWPLPDGL